MTADCVGLSAATFKAALTSAPMRGPVPVSASRLVGERHTRFTEGLSDGHHLSIRPVGRPPGSAHPFSVSTTGRRRLGRRGCHAVAAYPAARPRGRRACYAPTRGLLATTTSGLIASCACPRARCFSFGKAEPQGDLVFGPGAHAKVRHLPDRPGNRLLTRVASSRRIGRSSHVGLSGKLVTLCLLLSTLTPLCEASSRARAMP